MKRKRHIDTLDVLWEWKCTKIHKTLSSNFLFPWLW